MSRLARAWREGRVILLPDGLDEGWALQESKVATSAGQSQMDPSRISLAHNFLSAGSKLWGNRRILRSISQRVISLMRFSTVNRKDVESERSTLRADEFPVRPLVPNAFVFRHADIIQVKGPGLGKLHLKLHEGRFARRLRIQRVERTQSLSTVRLAKVTRQGRHIDIVPGSISPKNQDSLDTQHLLFRG